MKIDFSSICKQGGREYNQDAFSVHLGADNACLVVCDGLGSYFGSEIASATATNLVCEHFKEKAETTTALDAVEKNFLLKTFERAHERIHELKEDNPEISSSCTTVAVFATCFDKSICAHIGDSRIYIFRDNKLSFQTIDHSMAQYAVELGKIKPAQIRSHPDQNKLTRVLGSDYYTAPDINTMNTELEAGDVIILCTDGFWEYVFENEMEEDIASSMTPHAALEKMEKRLLKRVQKYNDNYTAVVAYVSESGDED